MALLGDYDVSAAILMSQAVRAGGSAVVLVYPRRSESPRASVLVADAPDHSDALTSAQRPNNRD